MAKKGTKKIRQVNIRGAKYFVYDLDENEAGKRKRIYGATKEEVEEKFRAYQEEREREIARYIPKNNLLKDYVNFFCKKSIGAIPSSDIKNIMLLFEKMVYGTEIDGDITRLTADDVKSFYLYLKEKFPIENVTTIDDTLRKIFTLANENGVQTFDFNEVPVPQDEKSSEYHDVPIAYMLSADEMKTMLDFCIDDKAVPKRSERIYWVIAFTFFTGVYISKTVLLKNKDFNLKNKTVTADGTPIPLSDDCIEWLKKITALKVLEVAKSENQSTGISCYTCIPELASMPPEQALEILLENPENLDGFVNSYMEQNPDDYFFLNKQNKPFATVTNVHRSLRTIAQKCGLPKGITLNSVHKSFIAIELANGRSAEILKSRYGYRSKQDIAEIQADYEIKQLLL